MAPAAAARAALLRHARPVGALLLAGGIYFAGLGGAHIPKNGDESPYANIARMTAASGRFLPLQSEIPELRNTKPPLLFWQGILSTDRGRDFTLWNLRYPSVIYTLLTASLVFLIARRCGASGAAGSLGALAYLAFYSTYRYGRPFLTDAPETFWLALPFFVLLYGGRPAAAARWLPALLGLFIGIGLLYKSFALIVPTALALSLWYLHGRGYRFAEFVRADAPKVGIVVLVALAVFSLWFVFDPHPKAVWREFVMRENGGKFAVQGGSYLKELLWGGSSLWTLILGIPANAGLLALPVAAMMGEALCRRGRLRDEEKLLWLWLLALTVAFALPSQRSARYLLAAMPAVAVLAALSWERLHRAWFLSTLAACLGVLAVLAYEARMLQRAMAVPDLYPPLYWLLLAAIAAYAVAAMGRAERTRPGAAMAVLLVYLALTLFLLPFDGARGRFGPAAERAVEGREVWVPSDFAASYEGYRFALPAARIRSYPASGPQRGEELARRYPLFTLRVPLGGAACAGCRVLGRRLELRGRLDSADLREILRGKIFATAFLEELLIESPRGPCACGGPPD